MTQSLTKTPAKFTTNFEEDAYLLGLYHAEVICMTPYMSRFGEYFNGTYVLPSRIAENIHEHARAMLTFFEKRENS